MSAMRPRAIERRMSPQWMWRESNPRGASVFKTLPLYRDTPYDLFFRDLTDLGGGSLPGPFSDPASRLFFNYLTGTIACGAVFCVTAPLAGMSRFTHLTCPGPPARWTRHGIYPWHAPSPPLRCCGLQRVKCFPPDATLRMQSDGRLSALTTTTLQ